VARAIDWGGRDNPLQLRHVERQRDIPREAVFDHPDGKYRLRRGIPRKLGMTVGKVMAPGHDSGDGQFTMTVVKVSRCVRQSDVVGLASQPPLWHDRPGRLAGAVTRDG
jgi:hypothetical protein